MRCSWQFGGSSLSLERKTASPVSQIHPGRHPFEELRELNLSTSELARRIQVPANRKAGILDGQLTVTGDAAPYVCS